jgi:very-short-patch-repair endonuclease
MGHKLDTDRLIAETAERQHGLITAGQLIAIGLGRSAIAKRVRTGRLRRLHRGVYAVGHAALPAAGRWLAAILACGGGPHPAVPILERWGAALSHRSAAELWGLLPVTQGLVDITVPTAAGKASRQGVRLHRCRTLTAGSVTLRAGIPVTTPDRTLADLRTLTRRGQLDRRTLRRAGRQAGILGLPIRGLERADRTRSDLERDFLRLCRRHRIPLPEVNVRIGPHLVDFAWQSRRVAVETDSYLYHRGREAFRADHRRDLDLRERGYDVLRFSEVQIEGEADRVASDVAAALRVGGRGRE